MNTKVVKTIDDIEIIACLDKLQIDQEGSKRAGKVIYFEPKLNETIISDEEYKTISEKLNALNDKELLSNDLKVIKNNKGIKYVKDNQILTIDKIGIEPDGKLLSDCTREELEQISISNMKDEEKTQAKENEKSYAMQKAINKKAELEILGDLEAIAKSQAFYADLLAEIEEKYK